MPTSNPRARQRLARVARDAEHLEALGWTPAQAARIANRTETIRAHNAAVRAVRRLAAALGARS